MVQVNIPDDYIQQIQVVRCINYSESDDIPDFRSFDSNMDAAMMSQLIGINTQLSPYDENEIFIS